MLSRLTESLKDLVPAEPRESQQPTLSFPPPPPAGSGTRSLCARCLTLLSHVTTEYGDGTEYKDLEILHSGCLPDLWREGPNDASTHAQKKSSIFATLRVLPSCVLCTKSLILIDAAMAHISFEPSLRDTPYKEWSLHWKIDAPDPKIYPQFAFPHDSLSVLININHKRGYGWGIGQPIIFHNYLVSAHHLMYEQEDLTYILIGVPLLQQVRSKRKISAIIPSLLPSICSMVRRQIWMQTYQNLTSLRH